MKICVTAQGNTLKSPVDPRFGRCRYFIIYDIDPAQFQAVENAQADFAGGAGIQSAQLIAGKGVAAVLTGNVGPNAFRTLDAAGIRIYTGVTGTVAEAVQSYKDGKLNSSSGPSVGSHFGTPK